MAIVKMKKLRLMAIKSQRDEILRKLVLLGCVEVTEPNTEELGENLAHESGELLKYREQFRDLTVALGLLDKYASIKDGMFAVAPEFKENAFLDSAGAAEQSKRAQEILELDEKVKKVMAEEQNQHNNIEALKPWLSMNIALDYKGTKNTGFAFGAVPAAAVIPEIKSAVMAVSEEAEIFEVSADKEQNCICVFFHETARDAVMEALRTFWFSQMGLAGMTGTATENTKLAEAKLKELAAQKEELSNAIIAHKAKRDELKLAIDHISMRMAEQEATEKIVSTTSTIVMEGWFPARDEKKLIAELETFDCAYETREPTEDETEIVPVVLHNNNMTKPMNVLTEMYSLPAYNGVDANPLMLLFFPMFFGIMFADVGYGLLLFLGGLFLKSKVKKGTINGFGGLGMQCGVMAMIFGACIGGFFGDAPVQIALMINPDTSFTAMPCLIDPLTNPFPILIGAIVIGVIQLLLGVCVNGYMLARDGQKADAFWAVAPIFILFAGLGLGAVGITWYVAIAGALMIFIAEGRAAGSVGGKIGSGLWGLYNFASGWFGDILSYARLMALMLAGSVVAQVFNTLGAMGGPIVFIIVFFIGHALNIALNLIGCFVHAVRLQYLEYFGKFYRDGGKTFTPLSVNTNYVDIIKED